MLYRETAAVCSETYTKKHKYSIGRMYDFCMLNVKMHQVTSKLLKVNCIQNTGLGVSYKTRDG
jgi:hypothetical protein